MTVPDLRSMGLGVRTLNPRKLGVSFSRLNASAKKGKISETGRGRVWVAVIFQMLPCLGWDALVMLIAFGVIDWFL